MMPVIDYNKRILVIDDTFPLSMNKLKQLPLGQKVLLAFGLICGLLLAIGGLFFFSLRAIERLNENQQSAAQHEMVAVRDAGKNGAMAVDKLTDYSEGEAREATTAITHFIDRTIKIVNLLVGVTILVAIGTGLAVVGVARRLKEDNGILQTEVAERKRAEGRLRGSEEKFHQLTDNITDAFWIRSPDMREVHYISPAFERIWGHSAESLHANPQQWVDCILPEDRERVLVVFATLTGAARSVSIEYRIARPDGEVRWVHVRGFQVRDAADELIRLTGVVTDITERKSAEEAIRESEERFRVTFEQAAAGIAHVAPDGHFLRVNDKLCDISGYSRNELLRLSFTELALPEELAKAEEARRSMLAGERLSFSTERRYRRKNGDVFWAGLVTTLLRESSGEPKYFISVIEDITPRKRAEESLRISEELFSSAFEHAPIGVALVSSEGRWLKVNRALCDLVGYSEAELLTRTFQDITHPEYLEVSLEYARQIIAGEIRSYQIEKRYVHARGHLITALLNVSVVRDGQGQPRYFIAQIQDITERKLSEVALEKAHMELVEASHQAGMAEVATGVLHNVGNVLNSVNVASSCLADSLRRSKAANLSKVVAMLHEHEADLGTFLTSDSKGRQVPVYLAQLAEHLSTERADALKELAHLQKNIEHIKDIVTMQQGFAKVSGLVETLQSSDLVEAALRMTPSSLARHDIQFIKEFGEGAPLTVDKRKVQQILINLVRNAEHACDASNLHEKRLTLRVTHVHDRVRIAVIDNGVGIPSENLARIFGHGFTTKKDGHGFGLHSCANAAKEMGGSLTAHSEGTDQGATFTLELPIRPPIRDATLRPDEVRTNA